MDQVQQVKQSAVFCESRCNWPMWWISLGPGWNCRPPWRFQRQVANAQHSIVFGGGPPAKITALIASVVPRQAMSKIVSLHVTFPIAKRLGTAIATPQEQGIIRSEKQVETTEKLQNNSDAFFVNICWTRYSLQRHVMPSFSFPFGSCRMKFARAVHNIPNTKFQLSKVPCQKLANSFSCVGSDLGRCQHSYALPGLPWVTADAASRPTPDCCGRSSKDMLGCMD